MSIKSTQGTETNNWTLAECILKDTTDPSKRVLEVMFSATIKAIERHSNIAINKSLKTKVWNRVEPKQIKCMKKIFLAEMCDAIPGNCNEKQIEAILQEYKKTGIIKQNSDGKHLQKVFAAKKESITIAVFDKANELLAEDLFIQVVQAFEAEGLYTLMQSKPSSRSLQMKIKKNH